MKNILILILLIILIIIIFIIEFMVVYYMNKRVEIMITETHDYGIAGTKIDRI